jgi:LCP family protein required for cell wall assembly
VSFLESAPIRKPSQPAQPDAFAAQLDKKKKKRGFGRVLFFTALIAIGGGLSFAMFTPQGQTTSTTVLEQIPSAIRAWQNPNLIFDNVGSDHVNLLLIGEDRNWVIKKVFNPRTGKYAPLNVIDTETPPRSDTMIIASLNKNTRKIRIISLPRDARIRYRDEDGIRHRTKLNAVYTSGGKDQEKRIATLKNFLSNEFGLRIDRHAVIKLDSFTELVNMVGGVYVNVDGALKRKNGKFYRGDIDYDDNWGKWGVHLKPGKQWLNGEQAHGYVRFRYDVEGDPGRIRRQQQVMQAIVSRMKSKPIYELPGVANEMRKHFNIDVTDEELASMALFSRGKDGDSKISPLTTFGTYAENGDVILNKPDNERLLSAIFGESFDPSRFLQISPSTERDEIGHTNNSNPAAREVLIEAGLLDPNKEPEKNYILDAPVRESTNR